MAYPVIFYNPWCALARILGARSVGMRGGFPLSPATKNRPRVIDND